MTSANPVALDPRSVGVPENDSLLRALRLQPTEHTPIWFMRQAGRSLPEYRAIKERYSLLEICRQPELCAEVTLQPVRRLGVDAAVLYADIILPLIGIGLDIQIVEGVGPVIEEPIRRASQVREMRLLAPEHDVDFVLAGIGAVLEELDGAVPLIGFSGAPFTLASYLIEGRPSRDFLQTKRLMYGDEELWDALMERLTEVVSAYLNAQIGAGVNAVQLFDSWAGALSPSDYRRYVLPYSLRVLEAVHGTGVPSIHFAANGAGLLEALRDAGGDAIGVDWRVPLDVAWRRIGAKRAIQGNLDPAVLLGPWEIVRREAEEVLRCTGGRPGHIFNTGHGLHPDTQPAQLERLVEFVHAWDS